MTRDEMFLDDTRWMHSINMLRNKHVSEAILAEYNLDRIHSLQQEVLNKQFAWEIPYICKIPKKTGGFRECFALPIKSRLVMSVIAGIYYDTTYWLFDEHCVSYQTGISVSGIVHSVRKQLESSKVVGYKVDLSKYFDSVPEDRVFSLLSELNTDCIVDDYVLQFYADKRLNVKGEITEHFRSLCQGCAISPILANLYLQDVDFELSQMCYYQRYSDDILLVGENADAALQRLITLLGDYGLSLNPKKIVSLDDEFEFLGARIGRLIGISSDNLYAIKREIKHRCSKRKMSRKGQRAAIKSLQAYLFKEDWNGHSLFKYYAGLVSDYNDFVLIDRYCRQCIRRVLTGKNNFTTNLHKTSDDMLQELGWVNIVDMLNLYNNDREQFDEIVHRLGGNYEFT